MEFLRIPVDYLYVKPLFRYINELCSCKCFPDLLISKVFPDAKELTESCAAYNALRHKAKVFRLNDRSVTMIAVADGNTPRTAALFAFRTAWKCLSIDPRLKPDKLEDWEGSIQRLRCIDSRIQDIPNLHFPKLVIAAVHSHAPLDIVAQKLTAAERVIVAIPCCVKQETDRPPDIEYTDRGIWSPHNKVKIWIDR